jgi:hypothetical protein
MKDKLHQKILKEALSVEIKEEEQWRMFLFSKRLVCDEIGESSQFWGLKFEEFLVWICFLSQSEPVKKKLGLFDTKKKTSCEQTVMGLVELLLRGIKIKACFPFKRKALS